MGNTHLHNLVIERLKNKDTTSIYADNEIFLSSLRNLLESREITLEQYADSLRRINHSSKDSAILEPITSSPQKAKPSEVYAPFSKGQTTPNFSPQKERVPNPHSLSGTNLFKSLGVDYCEN